MAELLPGTPPGTPQNPTAAQPVAGNGLPKPAPVVAGSPSAKATAVAHGGLHGGRKRCDGLVPGSEAAKEADKKHDAERQRKRRTQPSPLPSAAAVAVPPQSAPDGMGGLPAPNGAPPVPWHSEALKPIFDQLIPVLEDLTAKQIIERAEKAKLPQQLIQDIKKDAKWPLVAKKGLEISAPAVTAKLLNLTGISAEYQDAVVLVTSVATVASSHMMLLRRLDKLIAQQNPPPLPPNGEKKNESPVP